MHGRACFPEELFASARVRGRVGVMVHLEFDESKSDLLEAAKLAIHIVGLNSTNRAAVSESMETFSLRETTLKFATFVAREEVEEDLCLATALFLHSDTICGKRFVECIDDGGDSGRLLLCIFSRHVPRGRDDCSLVQHVTYLELNERTFHRQLS